MRSEKSLKAVTLSTRVSRGFKEQIQGLAASRGLTIAEYLYHVLELELAQEEDKQKQVKEIAAAILDIVQRRNVQRRHQPE